MGCTVSVASDAATQPTPAAAQQTRKTSLPQREPDRLVRSHLIFNDLVVRGATVESVSVDVLSNSVTARDVANWIDSIDHSDVSAAPVVVAMSADRSAP